MDYTSLNILLRVHIIFYTFQFNACLALIQHTDIDECTTNNGRCDHYCSNTISSFECSCMNGFSLAVDGLSCTGEITNPNLLVTTYGSSKCTLIALNFEME